MLTKLEVSGIFVPVPKDQMFYRPGQRTDPSCYRAKVSAHVTVTIAAKPELVQISTAYGGQKEGSPVLPRNKHTAIQEEKPKDKQQAQRPEYKTCKFATEAIITEGSDVGTIHKVCANPSCPVHHPKQSTSRNDENWKAEQESQRKEQAIANATGLRVLADISSSVPVRLLKSDLLFILEKLVGVMDENRVKMLATQLSIRQKRDDGGVTKTLAAVFRRADEGHADPTVSGFEHPARRLTWQSVHRAQGGCDRLQSGHRNRRRQGETGVCRKGEGEENAAASQERSE
jgi:ParB family chromosome partitioning protein